MLPHLREPKNEALIACVVPSWKGIASDRTYHIRRFRTNWYYSSMSGGQRKHTTDSIGPCGEPIQGTVEWHLENVGSFEHWIDFLRFLEAMRAEDIEIIYDP